jgi:phosphoserine aminotransferase
MATPPEEITEIKKNNSQAAIMVDMVSALPFYQPDWSNWDSVYFSVQKGFGLPAGLGVWVIRKSMINEVNGISPHRNLKRMMQLAENHQNPETPNVLGIYLLSKVTGDMLRRGIDNIRIETNYKFALAYHAFSELSFLKPFIQEEKYRSKTTIVAECIDIAPQKIIEHLMKSGIQIGTGYGPFKDSQIRIANFPTHSKEVFELLVDKLKEI